MLDTDNDGFLNVEELKNALKVGPKKSGKMAGTMPHPDSSHLLAIC